MKKAVLVGALGMTLMGASPLKRGPFPTHTLSQVNKKKQVERVLFNEQKNSYVIYLKGGKTLELDQRKVRIKIDEKIARAQKPILMPSQHGYVNIIFPEPMALKTYLETI